MKITTVNFSNLKPSHWAATHTLLPDLRLLIKSISDHGWIYPIVARADDSTIIDGFARWIVAGSDKTIMRRDRGEIPVQWIDCDEKTAKILHIRLNRARGVLAVQKLAPLVRDLAQSSGYEEEQLRGILGMTSDEFYALLNPSLIKSKKLVEHSYSAAWVPVELPPGASVSVPSIEFEKPPNADH